MSIKTDLKLLVLFGVLCQGIIGTIAEKDIEESSELLLRQKRVINRNPGADVRQMMRNVPYILQVKLYYQKAYCIGVILSIYVVLTLAKCAEYNAGSYRVYSGRIQKLNSNSHIIRHIPGEKIVMKGYNPHNPEEGIALISVIQPFVYSENTQNIELYEGEIHPRSDVTVSGWGCHATGDPGTAHPNYLRSITVPTISNRDCATLHTDSFTILDSHICTFDSTGHQYCGANDDGAPLVITVNGVTKLVGIHLWNGRGVAGLVYPDVFINLKHPRYKNWIQQNVRLLNQNASSSRNSRNH